MPSSLPEFNHHRAADDALTCGLIFHRLSRQLEEMGLHSLQAINPAMPALRAKNKIGDRHARHIILFAKNPDRSAESVPPDFLRAICNILSEIPESPNQS